MVRSSRRHLLVVVLAGFALLVIPLAALADPSDPFGITIVGPGPYAGAGITVLDNAAGDLNTALNQITIQAGTGGLPAIPGFAASIDIALSNTPGGPASSLLDTNFTLSSLNAAGGTIQVTTSATGYTFPGAGVSGTLQGSIGGTLVSGTGNITVQEWANTANTFFQSGPVSGTTPGLQGPFVGGAFSDTKSIGFTSVTPFSLTDRINLTLGPNSLTTGNLATTATPEPATLLLLGSGMSGLAALVWRRRRDYLLISTATQVNR